MILVSAITMPATTNTTIAAWVQKKNRGIEYQSYRPPHARAAEPNPEGAQ